MAIDDETIRHRGQSESCWVTQPIFEEIVLLLVLWCELELEFYRDLNILTDLIQIHDYALLLLILHCSLLLLYRVNRSGCKNDGH